MDCVLQKWITERLLNVQDNSYINTAASKLAENYDDNYKYYENDFTWTFASTFDII